MLLHSSTFTSVRDNAYQSLMKPIGNISKVPHNPRIHGAGTPRQKSKYAEKWSLLEEHGEQRSELSALAVLLMASASHGSKGQQKYVDESILVNTEYRHRLDVSVMSHTYLYDACVNI